MKLNSFEPVPRAELKSIKGGGKHAMQIFCIRTECTPEGSECGDPQHCYCDSKLWCAKL